jgi:hypothetical protein
MLVPAPFIQAGNPFSRHFPSVLTQGFTNQQTFSDSGNPLIPAQGAALTLSRNTTASVVIAPDTLTQSASAGELRMHGWRRVGNILTETENGWAAFLSGDIALGATNLDSPIGTTNARRYTGTAAGFARQYITSLASNFKEAGDTFVFSIWLRGTGSVNLIWFDSGTYHGAHVVLWPTWQRFAVSATLANTPTDVRAGIFLEAVTGAVAGTATQWDEWGAQIEVTTGKANKNPSTYESVGINTSPYHGFGADGIEYFSTANGDTLDGNNVIAVASGAALDLSVNVTGSNGVSLLPGAMIEPAGTNYLINPSAPVTQTTGALGTGAYTLWVGASDTGSATVSAGTGTGTGMGAATAGAPVTFTVTGAGTFTVTVAGTVAWFQLEGGSHPTSRIDGGGGTGSRAADVLAGNTANVVLANEGKLQVQYCPSWTGAQYLWGSYTDAANWLRLYYDGSKFIFEARIAATTYQATRTIAISAGTQYTVAGLWTSTALRIRVNGVEGTAVVIPAQVVLASTHQLGADGNSANQHSGTHQSLQIWRRAA